MKKLNKNTYSKGKAKKYYLSSKYRKRLSEILHESFFDPDLFKEVDDEKK